MFEIHVFFLSEIIGSTSPLTKLCLILKPKKKTIGIWKNSN